MEHSSQQAKICGHRPLWALTLAICAIYSLNGGIRGNFGILLAPLADNSHLSYSEVSFILAVSQLIFGLLQPVFGLLAMRFSERNVMMAGCLFLAAGFLFTPFATSYAALFITVGLLLPTGTAALSFGLLLGIVSPQVSPRQSSMISGWLNASSGIGTTLLAPVLQGLLMLGGLLGAMIFLGIPTLLFLPLTVWLCRAIPQTSCSDNKPAPSLMGMMMPALHDRSYQFLIIAFLTCGFHMSILETHFFNQLTSLGFERTAAALCFTLYGLFTMAGSALSGWLCARCPMCTVLGTIYALRILAGLLVLMLPPSFFYFAPLILLIGFTSDSTVSPTSGLILQRFGPEKLATLFGLAFLMHQIGCFAGAWAGGVIAERFGNYHLLWLMDMALAFLAAILSFRVKGKEKGAAGGRP